MKEFLQLYISPIGIISQIIYFIRHIHLIPKEIEINFYVYPIHIIMSEVMYFAWFMGIGCIVYGSVFITKVYVMQIDSEINPTEEKKLFNIISSAMIIFSILAFDKSFLVQG